MKHPTATAGDFRHPRREVPLKRAVLASAVTSQIAALIMAVVVMIVFALFLGESPLYPVQVIGSSVFGERALEGLRLDALLAGLVVHMLVGLAWGIVFGTLAAQLGIVTVRQAVLTGVVVAVVSMLDTYVFVPAFMQYYHDVDIWRREIPMVWNWAAHIVFGLSFGFYPWVYRKMYR